MRAMGAVIAALGGGGFLAAALWAMYGGGDLLKTTAWFLSLAVVAAGFGVVKLADVRVQWRRELADLVWVMSHRNPMSWAAARLAQSAVFWVAGWTASEVLAGWAGWAWMAAAAAAAAAQAREWWQRAGVRNG